MKHLWETDHAYYCNETNYFESNSTVEYGSFADFLENEGDADFDYNLVFRWDWVEGEDEELPPYNGDDSFRNGLLKVFWMGQRKGAFRSTTVKVCRADENEIKKFLIPRWQYLRGLWEGIAEISDNGDSK